MPVRRMTSAFSLRISRAASPLSFLNLRSARAVRSSTCCWVMPRQAVMRPAWPLIDRVVFADEAHGLLDRRIVRQLELDRGDVVLQGRRDVEVHADEDHGPAGVGQDVADLAEPGEHDVEVREGDNGNIAVIGIMLISVRLVCFS
jgi:predicted transport protein